MPLAVEIVLIVIGIGLLALALIGSGISRRLMTIPKMRRVPRVVLAGFGVLLLAGGMWGVSTETKESGPSLAALKAHIPDGVLTDRDCDEASESPKGAVALDCSAADGVPDLVRYAMFSDVNAMHDYWVKQAGPSDLQGSACDTQEDFTTGGTVTWYDDDPSVVVGDYACYMDDSRAWVIYTDRRLNIVVTAQTSSPEYFSEFLSWVDETSHPQPEGGENDTPATPSDTSAAMR